MIISQTDFYISYFLDPTVTEAILSEQRRIGPIIRNIDTIPVYSMSQTQDNRHVKRWTTNLAKKVKTIGVAVSRSKNNAAAVTISKRGPPKIRGPPKTRRRPIR
jgi:hypothetical protein